MIITQVSMTLQNALHKYSFDSALQMRDRQLNDMPLKAPDAREQLLASIRQEQKLRPTPGRISECSA